MLLATIGDILTIRKNYQKTFQLNSDESADDNSLTCFDVNAFLETLLEIDEEEPITGPMLAEIFKSCMVEVSLDEGDNFFSEINDPTGSGSTNVGFSGKDKYDSLNYYEPETLDDNREFDDPVISMPKSKPKSNESEYNKTRITSTGRKARVNT